MLLADLVETSRLVASTAARKEKVELLAGLMRRLAPEERSAAIAFLTGEAPGGKLGVGWAAIVAARSEGGAGACPPPLTIAAVAQSLATIAGVRGKGSAAARQAELRALIGDDKPTGKVALEPVAAASAKE